MAPPSGWEAYIVVRSITEGETLKLVLLGAFLQQKHNKFQKWKEYFFGGDLKEAEPFRRWCSHLTLSPPPHTNIYPACCWLTPCPTPMHRSLLGAPL